MPLFENYEPYIKDNKGINTNYPATFGGALTANGATTFNGAFTVNGAIQLNNAITFGVITQGSVQVIGTTTGTLALTPTSTVATLTPTGNMTLNFTNTATIYTGAYFGLEVVTSGTSSFTLTFGTGTKNQGTLATGTVSAKTFMVQFVNDGTNWVETSRTTAM